MLFNAIPMLRVRNREMLKKKKNRQQRIINGPTLIYLLVALLLLLFKPKIAIIITHTHRTVRTKIYNN